MSEPEDEPLTAEETLHHGLLELIEDHMKSKGVTTAELGSRLGKTGGAVSQFFGAYTSPTLRTVSRYLEALDLVLDLKVITKEQSERVEAAYERICENAAASEVLRDDHEHPIGPVAEGDIGVGISGSAEIGPEEKAILDACFGEPPVLQKGISGRESFMRITPIQETDQIAHPIGPVAEGDIVRDGCGEQEISREALEAAIERANERYDPVPGASESRSNEDTPIVYTHFEPEPPVERRDRLLTVEEVLARGEAPTLADLAKPAEEGESDGC